jgi:hypothetical protein
MSPRCYPLVGQPTHRHRADQHFHALGVWDPEGRPVGVPVIKLGQVAGQVDLADVVVCPVKTSFQLTKEVLCCVAGDDFAGPGNARTRPEHGQRRRDERTPARATCNRSTCAGHRARWGWA